MPASAFSRSTECHNQDKVSMGTIAAHDCQFVLDGTETIAAIFLLALAQAVDIRKDQGCGARSMALHQAVREMVPMNERDRPQDEDIARVLHAYRNDRLPIGAWEPLQFEGGE
jgi:histidine ammonia-lyase